MARRGPGNPKYLRPIQSGEEARQMGLKGCVASMKTKQRIKTLRERLKILLQFKDAEGVTKQELACLALVEKAIKGDVRAFEMIRDTIGEKPVDKTLNKISGKNAGLKIILLGEDSAKKRDSDPAKEQTEQDS